MSISISSDSDSFEGMFDFLSEDVLDLETTRSLDNYFSENIIPDGETYQEKPRQKRKSGPEIAQRVALKKRNRILFGLGGAKPNLSRRPPTATLYAFPNFDKCDSLLYFPSTFSRLVNTGDFRGMEKLLASHGAKDCDVRMCFSPEQRLTLRSIVRMYEILNELQPDAIMVMHSTKVVENEVRSLVYVKATESKSIHDSVSKSITEPLFAPVFNTNRADYLKIKVGMQKERDEEERRRQLALAESEDDLIAYIQTEFVLTFDDITKKVKNFTITGKNTSLEPISVI